MIASQEAAVLDYFRSEARGVHGALPLKLPAFRVVRARLLEQGVLIRTTGGRHVPADSITRSET